MVYKKKNNFIFEPNLIVPGACPYAPYAQTWQCL